MIQEVDMEKVESLAKAIAAVCGVSNASSCEVLVAIGVLIGSAADNGSFKVDLALSLISDTAHGQAVEFHEIAGEA